jgi:hypothetical protein
MATGVCGPIVKYKSIDIALMITSSWGLGSRDFLRYNLLCGSIISRCDHRPHAQIGVWFGYDLGEI